MKKEGKVIENTNSIMSMRKEESEIYLEFSCTGFQILLIAIFIELFLIIVICI
jgi:hypothetical protein